MALKEPPPAPEVPRRFRLHRYQMIGLPLIALLPILAFFQVFGNTTEVEHIRSSSIQAEIEYPSKLKFRQSSLLRVKITNLTEQALGTITVSLDTAYLAGFIDVTIVPEPIDAYVVELTDLQPKEKREVIAELQAERYGAQEGNITIRSKQETLQHQISTTIYW